MMGQEFRHESWADVIGASIPADGVGKAWIGDPLMFRRAERTVDLPGQYFYDLYHELRRVAGTVVVSGLRLEQVSLPASYWNSNLIPAVFHILSAVGRAEGTLDEFKKTFGDEMTVANVKVRKQG